MQGLQSSTALVKGLACFIRYFKALIFIISVFVFLSCPTLSLSQSMQSGFPASPLMLPKPTLPVQPGYPEYSRPLVLPKPTFKHEELLVRHHVHIKTKIGKLSQSNSSTALLDRFYALQKTNRPAAEDTLLVLLKKDPNNAIALSELGYMYINDNKPEEAITVFKSAYNITGNYNYASQIGYLLDGVGRKKEAYYYFEKATHSPDAKLRQQSNEAMTNLAGWQTKTLSDPYFADVYISPFYWSRFNLADFPFQGRFGVALGTHKQWELYVGARGAWDDRSQPGTTPQLFDDDAVIFALGVRYQPFYTVPLYFYSEVGKGYDLIYRNRSRWRNDFRGGAFYQKAWGAAPTYSENFRFTFKPVGDVYATSSFYTRYNDNLITSAILRQGFRVMEYKSSSLGVYVRAFAIVDTNQEFYNNLAEIGPGIIWVPNNRYGMDFRFEYAHGYYFKVNSPDHNPYGSNYNNFVSMFELYQRF
jgi:tetratricopeptide (TPR) repeat protein